MKDYEFPPFRIREQDGSPNVIPVYELIVSNGTLTNLGQGKVSLATGAGGSTSTAGLVQSSITISTVYPVSGGGDLSVNRSHFVDTAFLINSGRTISSTYPLAGGGNLSANRTLTVDTAFLINTGRTVSTTYPLAGGGNLSANRTLTVDTAFLVNTNRLISAGAGLSGGGNLSADRTLSLVTPVSVQSGGTGTSTQMSTGAIIFAGAAGAYSQNTNFNFDNSNTRLIVGTTLGTTQRFSITDGTWFNVGAVTATLQESVGNCVLNFFANTDNRTSEIQFGYPTNANRFSLRTINSSNFNQDSFGFVTGSQLQFALTLQGSLIHGTGGVLATTAVDGFSYFRATSGAPTGTPTSFGLFETPLVYDTSNNRLYIYNGAWRSVALT